MYQDLHANPTIAISIRSFSEKDEFFVWKIPSSLEDFESKFETLDSVIPIYEFRFTV